MICVYIKYVVISFNLQENSNNTWIKLFLCLLQVGVAGIGASSNAYILGFSYLYSQISDRQQYQKATSIVSTSLQLGVFCGSVLSQIIVSTTGGIYTILPYCNASGKYSAIIAYIHTFSFVHVVIDFYYLFYIMIYQFVLGLSRRINNHY